MNAYTCEIEKGQTFEDFVLRCTRAFIIEMRDKSFNDPIPDKFEPDNYYKEQIEYHVNCLNETEIILTNLENNPKKFEIYLKVKRDERLREIEDLTKLNANRRELKKKYNEMLQKVLHWKPPSDKYNELKKFMTYQLHESITFDCNEVNIPSPEITKEDCISDLESIKNEHKEQISYYKDTYKESVKLAREWTTWMKQLKESIK